MYIFITIIFIAEIIIALQILQLIVRLDSRVCDMSDCISEFNPLADLFLKYTRLQIELLNKKIANVIKFLDEKKRKTIFRIILLITLNFVFILFKIKKIKTHKVINLMVAVADIATDLSVL